MRGAPLGGLGHLAGEGEQLLDQRALGRVQRRSARRRVASAAERRLARARAPAFASIEAIRAWAYWT